MILTIKHKMQDRDGKPTKLRDALKMFYSGRLSPIAEQLNREALAEAELDYIELQSIGLERTEEGDTLLVIVTAAILRETND